MANPDIWKHGFGANPQNINRKGRPRKSFSKVNKKLSEMGVDKISKDDLMDAYKLVMNMEEDDMLQLLEDENVPIAFKLIIEQMTDPKKRAEAFKDLRDWMFGRSHQVVEHKFKEQPLFPDVNHKAKALPEAKEALTIEVQAEEVKVEREDG